MDGKCNAFQDSQRIGSLCENGFITTGICSGRVSVCFSCKRESERWNTPYCVREDYDGTPQRFLMDEHGAPAFANNTGKET